MDKQGFNDLIGNIRTNIGEEASALNSENFLAAIAAYNELVDKVSDKDTEISKLKSSNDELLKTNGRLFQKIGFNDPEPTSIEDRIPKTESIRLEDIIDEKGGFKNGK